MSVSLENVNVSRAFTEPLDVPIMHSRTLLIDSLEFVWGLNRGDTSSYFNVPGNFLRVQPELKEAIEAEDVALVPPNHIVEELYAFQEQNAKLPFAKRRAFTEVAPFKPCEYRVVPLKPGVSLYTLNPTTRKVTPFRGTRTSFPSVSCSAHPFFVITYACFGLVNPSKTVRRKLALGQLLIQCFGPWHMAPPFEFYEGVYIGQFGRSVPYKYRPLLPKGPGVAKDHVYSSSSSSSQNASVVDEIVSCAVCGFHSSRAFNCYTIAHVMERLLAGNQEKLERSWGLEPGTFFLGSRANTIILCPSCYTVMDKKIVGLLPPTHVIDFASKAAEERKSSPLSSPEALKYRLIDIDWRGNNPFVVFLNDKNSKRHILGIDPPFDHPLLSSIELGVNPVHMVWILGLQLKDVDVETLDVPAWVRDDLRRVRQLCRAWEEPVIASGSEEETVQSVTPSLGATVSEPRREKRLRGASMGSGSANDISPPSKRSKHGKTKR